MNLDFLLFIYAVILVFFQCCLAIMLHNHLDKVKKELKDLIDNKPPTAPPAP